ncbi:hypothetical protein CASFOL_004475 [Castilleja foliolosa]|uniref:UBC core domain-containing protein n=1 Tax=Castilleja foliolosa TaxID=1961234 RepID=A0ABD3EAK4_9LAMI
MSSPCKRRDTDVMKLMMSDFTVEPINDGLNEFSVEFHGPKESPYEGGVWKVHVELPDAYPYKSPSIGFLNRIFHPNVDEQSGSVCLDVINQSWSPMFELKGQPRRADLDMNHHINNDAYIGWVLECVPKEIIDSHEVQTITLEFRRECQQDDVVDCLTAPKNGFSELRAINGSPPVGKDENHNLQFLHLLRLSNNGSEINRGHTVWRMKPAKR